MAAEPHPRPCLLPFRRPRLPPLPLEAAPAADGSREDRSRSASDFASPCSAPLTPGARQVDARDAQDLEHRAPHFGQAGFLLVT